MKTEKKAYLFLLIMICIVIFACGCKNNAGKDTVSDTAFSLTKENLSQYLIIIPDKSDSKMLDAAKELKNRIMSITGTEIKIKSDFLAEGSDEFSESQYEILLGYVNRQAIEDLYRDQI